MALADVYDALISKRVYKEGFSHEKALGIIADGREPLAPLIHPALELEHRHGAADGHDALEAGDVVWIAAHLGQEGVASEQGDEQGGEAWGHVGLLAGLYEATALTDAFGELESDRTETVRTFIEMVSDNEQCQCQTGFAA